MSDLDYSRILCGVIRGALEMVMLDVDVAWKQGKYLFLSVTDINTHKHIHIIFSRNSCDRYM